MHEGLLRICTGRAAAANMAAWPHQLTAAIRGEDIRYGHGARSGQAMIAILCRRVIASRVGSSGTRGA